MADETMEITTPITRIQQNNDINIYDLGAIFENVYLGMKDDKLIPYTLKNLYEELQNFFDNSDFILYSNTAPTDSHVKIWYQTMN